MSKATVAIGVVLILFGVAGYGILGGLFSSLGAVSSPGSSSGSTSLFSPGLALSVDLALYWLLAVPGMFILVGIGLIVVGRRPQLAPPPS